MFFLHFVFYFIPYFIFYLIRRNIKHHILISLSYILIMSRYQKFETLIFILFHDLFF